MLARDLENPHYAITLERSHENLRKTSAGGLYWLFGQHTGGTV